MQPENSEIEPLAFRSLGGVGEADPPPDEETEALAATSPEEPPIDLQAIVQEAQDAGRREATERALLEIEEKVLVERASVARLVQQFAEEKQRYFKEVETEVVKLSLAIAERVLHREAEMDPILLAGAARVALDQIADSSNAVLHVAAGDAQGWSRMLADAPNGMQIKADADLSRGEAVLKTRSGTVQLGLRAQLQEIERGFFELLDRRPAMVA